MFYIYLNQPKFIYFIIYRGYNKMAGASKDKIYFYKIATAAFGAVVVDGLNGFLQAAELE